jgi:anti-anti-sigma factor
MVTANEARPLPPAHGDHVTVSNTDLFTPAIRSPAHADGSASLRIDVELGDATAVLRLCGPLTGRAAGHARNAMSRALADAPGKIVVDLSGVTSAEDSGAVLLVAMRRHARRLGSTLQLADVDADLRRVLRRRGIDRLLGIADARRH